MRSHSGFRALVSSQSTRRSCGWPTRRGEHRQIFRNGESVLRAIPMTNSGAPFPSGGLSVDPVASVAAASNSTRPFCFLFHSCHKQVQMVETGVAGGSSTFLSPDSTLGLLSTRQHHTCEAGHFHDVGNQRPGAFLPNNITVAYCDFTTNTRFLLMLSQPTFWNACRYKTPTR